MFKINDTYIMKKTSILLALFPLLTAAQSPSVAIKDYFKKVISAPAGTLAPAPDATLQTAQISADEAWTLWQESFTEASCYTKQAINADSQGAYEIPETLEPNARMPYYYGTKGEKPAEGYPFFLYLHGSGPKANEWATGLKLANYFKDGPSAYLVPQIPNEGEYYRWWQRGKQYVWQHVLRSALLDKNINPLRLYFFGISEGGYGSQRLASFYADYLAGAGPMAGGEPLQNAPAENLMHTAFSLRTGELDRAFYRDILTRRTGAALDTLAVHFPGYYRHWIHLPEGRGHSIDYAPTTPWLAGHVRNAAPQTFRWENFEMDGWKRNAFYNLKVVEEVADSAGNRTFYTYETRKNEIHITAEHVAYEITIRDPGMGIPLSQVKHYTPSPHGKLRIFLDERLFNPKRAVTVFVNGKQVFKGKLQPSAAALAESIATFADPCRRYPYAVDAEW